MKKLRLLMFPLAALAIIGLTGQNASADNSLLFGQEQAYTAVVRSDQKVVTYGKLVYNNPDTKDFSKSSFTLPAGVKVENLTAYQILPPSDCKDSDTEDDDLQARYSYEPTCNDIKEDIYTIDSYGYYYDSGEADLLYRPVALQKQDATYSFSLPEPIAPNEQGAILVSYIATNGYVSGNLGFYALEFKTLQVPQSVKEVRVAVDVSNDLYTRAKQSSVERISIENDIASGATAADAAGGVTSANLDKLQGNIGTGGQFTKTGKSLMSNETFVVKGNFTDAAWKLNISWVIGSTVGLIVVTGLSIILMKKANSVHAGSTNIKKGKK